MPEEDLLEESPPGQEEKVENAEEKKLEQDLMKEREFQPIIEINFDEENKKQDKPSAEKEAYKEAPPKIIPGFEAFSPRKDVKKKKNLLFAGIIVIVVIVIAIVLYLVFVSGKSRSGLSPEGEITEVKPPLEQQLPTVTASESDSEAQIQEEKEALAPDAGKGDEPGKIEPPKEKEIREPTQISTVPQTSEEEKITPDIPEKTKKKKESKKADTEKEQPGEKQAPQQDKAETTEEKTKPDETQIPEVQTVPEEPAPEEKKPPVEEKKTPELGREAIVKPGDILSPSQVDTQPIPISTPNIKITPTIRRLMMSDQRVLVSYLVDHNGNIETVKLLKKSSMKRLNNLIIETIKKWKYKPATKNNIKVKVWKNKWIAITK